VSAERIIKEGALATVLTVSARKLDLHRQVLQRNISGFQELLFTVWAIWDCRSAGIADVVATQTEGDGRHHVLIASRTLQLCQNAFTDVRLSSLHAECNETIVHTVEERTHPPETQKFDQYNPAALLPHSDTSLFPSHTRTTEFFLSSLPYTA